MKQRGHHSDVLISPNCNWNRIGSLTSIDDPLAAFSKTLKQGGFSQNGMVFYQRLQYGRNIARCICFDTGDITAVNSSRQSYSTVDEFDKKTVAVGEREHLNFIINSILLSIKMSSDFYCWQKTYRYYAELIHSNSLQNLRLHDLKILASIWISNCTLLKIVCPRSIDLYFVSRRKKKPTAMGYTSHRRHTREIPLDNPFTSKTVGWLKQYSEEWDEWFAVHSGMVQGSNEAVGDLSAECEPWTDCEFWDTRANLFDLAAE